jgi:hypothetical protein
LSGALKLHRRAAVLEDGIGAGVHMVPTLGTGERLAARNAVKRGFLGTLPADVMEAVPDFHNMGQAGIVIRETGEKFAD